MTRTATRGVLFVHSAPSALCPHVEWAAGGVLGNAVNLEWTPQPAQAGTYRAEYSWTGDAGTAAAVTSAPCRPRIVSKSSRLSVSSSTMSTRTP